MDPVDSDQDDVLVTFVDPQKQRIMNRVAYGLLCRHIDVLEAQRPIDKRVAGAALYAACDMACRFGYGATMQSVDSMIAEVMRRFRQSHGELPQVPPDRRAYLAIAATSLVRVMEERRVPGT